MVPDPYNENFALLLVKVSPPSQTPLEDTVRDPEPPLINAMLVGPFAESQGVAKPEFVLHPETEVSQVAPLGVLVLVMVAPCSVLRCHPHAATIRAVE
jgi:hypothetical protein